MVYRIYQEPLMKVQNCLIYKNHIYISVMKFWCKWNGKPQNVQNEFYERHFSTKSVLVGLQKANLIQHFHFLQILQRIMNQRDFRG